MVCESDTCSGRPKVLFAVNIKLYICVTRSRGMSHMSAIINFDF